MHPFIVVQKIVVPEDTWLVVVVVVVILQKDQIDRALADSSHMDGAVPYYTPRPNLICRLCSTYSQNQSD